MSFLFDDLEFLKKCGFETKEEFDEYRKNDDHFNHLKKIISDWCVAHIKTSVKQGRERALALENFVLEKFDKEKTDKEHVDLEKLDEIYTNLMKMYIIDKFYEKLQELSKKHAETLLRAEQAEAEAHELREILKSYRRFE